MKVLNAMSKKVDFVTPKHKVKEIAKLIFGHRINGVPVVKNKKVIGFITERDILSQFYPSMQEYMEDPVNEANFERMEKKIARIFEMTADKIMSKLPVVISPDAPLLEAQSLMFIHKIGRLPVVDKKKNIVGIIAKGDIFKYLVGKRLKMKKILFSFIFFLILMSPTAYAQTDISLPNISTTPTPAPFKYDLPYPGILPGSFLYNLKAIRDRIMETFISDPVKKSSFYLLQADKRLAASLMLFDRGENVLAETTLSKSQNYLEKALEKAEEVNKLKGRFGETDERIKLSSRKQIEELEKLIKRIKGETNQRLKGDLKRAKEIQKRAEKLE